MERLRAAGFEADYEPHPEGSLMKYIRAAPPAALVIDLSRMPSHGREVGVHVRASKRLRHIPLVYVDGAADKVEVVRQWLPDAVYTTWAEVGAALHKVVTQDGLAAAPATPPPIMQRYGNRTVAQKLGIDKPGITVAVINPPRTYRKALDPLPEGVEPDEDPARAGAAVTLWFVENAGQYMSALRRMLAWAPHTRLWVLWPKGRKRGDSDDAINETLVREAALSVGLVDYKVCSFDATWSALALAVRKEKRKNR